MMHDDSADMTFGRRLRTARKNGGLTQEQLAERLLVTRQAIAKWESDKEFYLVIDGEKQFLITATDEFIESRQLSRNISERKFVIGGFKFVDCGVMPK